MRIEKELEYFVIYRGNGRRESAFCFFVDHDKSCWTAVRPWEARRFNSLESAEECLAELRHRARLRKGHP